MRRITSRDNRDEQIKVLQNELRSLVSSSQTIVAEMHKRIHELLASIESGEPYGSYFPEHVKCKFCGVEEE